VTTPLVSGNAVSAASAEGRGPSDLPTFFNRIAKIPGEFVVHDDGYRGWSWSYREVARIAQTFRSRLRAAGVGKGHTVMIWSESRPGWLAALWACILEGIALVPVEPRSSQGLFHRIRQKVEPRLILRGDRVPALDGEVEDVPVWLVSEIENAVGEASPESVLLYGDDIAEIVFTSGTTAEPRGVVITHRNLAASLRPIEEQFAPYLRYVRPFAPLRISQSAAHEPPVWAGARNIRSATDSGFRHFHFLEKSSGSQPPDPAQRCVRPGIRTENPRSSSKVHRPSLSCNW